MAIHQYPSTETFPSATTYPGVYPDIHIRFFTSFGLGRVLTVRLDNMRSDI